MENGQKQPYARSRSGWAKFLERAWLIFLILGLGSIPLSQLAGDATWSESILLGLILNVIGFQLELLARIIERNSWSKDSADLLSNLTDHPSLLPLVTSLVNSAAATLDTKTEMEPFRAAAHETLRDAGTELMQLAQGKLRRHRGDTDLMEQAYALVKKDVMAVTETADEDWWDSSSGARALAMNKSAIARGVRITRVFILDSPSSMASIIERSTEAGIECHPVLRSEVPAELLVNLTVFDDFFGHQDNKNGDGRTVSYDYSINEGDVRLLQSLARRLLSIRTVRDERV